MNYADVLNNARQCIGQYCKACPVCNGVACKNQIPGPGAKGVGDTAIRNYNKWADIRVNMDTLCENGTPDTHVELFGRSFKYPFFAGPVGAVNLHYSDTYTDMTYNDVLVRACAENGRSAGEKTDRGQPFSNGLHRQRHGKTGIFASRPTGNGFVADIIRKHAAPRKQDRTPCPSRIAGNGMPSNRNTSQQPKRPAYADPTPPFQNFSEARSRPANGFRRASRESAECRRNACLGR